MSCLLCDIPGQTGEILFEDELALVIVHDDWATRGHLMVVWKAHVQNLSDLSDEEALHLVRLYRVAEQAVLKATGAERAIILKLGIAVPHLHLHIYPVSSTLDRSAVMEIIDGKVMEAAGESDRRAFTERLRTALAAFPA